MTGAARITIELEPPAGANGRWVARTLVQDDSSRPDATAAWPGAAASAGLAESREPAVVPTAYEPPAECLCLDEGDCDFDHANE